MLILVVPSISENDNFCPGRMPVICNYKEYTPPTIDPLSTLTTTKLARALEEKTTNPKRATLIFENLLFTYPSHPNILFEYALFLEQQKDLLASHHNYLLAFHYGCREDALQGYERTLREVEQIDLQQFESIQQKAHTLKELSKERLEFQREQKAMDVMHIYHTNALEGSSLSMYETQFIMETKRVDGIKGRFDEVSSVIGVQNALEFIRRIDKKPLHITEETILQLHRYIYGNIDINVAGQYRQLQVYVGGHVPPPPEDVPQLMTALVEWLQSTEFKLLHPIEAAALTHYQLVWIHPFVDGNGRTSRMLMNLILVYYNYPEAVIKQEDRLSYYDTLLQADRKMGGDTRPFIRFVARAIEQTIDQYLSVLPQQNQQNDNQQHEEL